MGITFSWAPGATPIDPDEAAALIPALQTQSELNEFEAQNILLAMSWAQRSRVIRAKLLEPSTLKTLHRKMFDQTWKWAGTYRTSQKNIGCEAWQIGTKMVSLRDDVKVWLECQSYPPDEIAARFHHQLCGSIRFRMATEGLHGLRLTFFLSNVVGKFRPGVRRTLDAPVRSAPLTSRRSEPLTGMILIH